MIGHLLTEKELDLLIELLNAESQRITVEARRTQHGAAHEEIRNRERDIDRILERFRDFKAGLLKAR